MVDFVIRYNKILDDITRAHALTKEALKERAIKPTDIDKIREKIDAYNQILKPIKDILISEIERMTGVKFPYSRINVNVVHVVYQTEAFALIVPSSLTPDGFLLTIIHELMHLSGGVFSDEYKKRYESEIVECRIHIMIHAMIERALHVIGRADLLDIAYEKTLRHPTPDYTRAWDIVRRDGYDNILALMKKVE